MSLEMQYLEDLISLRGAIRALANASAQPDKAYREALFELAVHLSWPIKDQRIVDDFRTMHHCVRIEVAWTDKLQAKP